MKQDTSEPNIEQMQARMAHARAKRRMTLEEVAAASGFAKSHVWELETGRSRNPTVRAVWSISRALGVTPAWLLGLDAKSEQLDPFALQVATMIDRQLRLRDVSTGAV